jgi:nucleoside-diphosphate kinase
MATEQTLGIIKPDAVQDGHIGDIIAMIEHAGLAIRGIRMTHLTRDQASRFYAVHEGKFFYEGLVNFMTSGPVVVVAIEGEGAISRWRALMGPTDSTQAGPDTVRGRYGKTVSINAVHGSDAPETARHEVAFFFGEDARIRPA